MTRDEAVEALRTRGVEDFYHLTAYADEGALITLDGEFTVSQLESIVEVLKMVEPS